MKTERWFVEVVTTEGSTVIHKISCSSKRAAERVENGVDMNLNHFDYFTRVVCSTPKEETK